MDKFVVIDMERSIGTGRIHYWKDNCRGYTTKPGEIGRYNKTDAMFYVNDDVDRVTIAVNFSDVEKVLRKYGEIE